MNNQSATHSAGPDNEFLHPDSGFIRHPADRPINVRRLPFWRGWRLSNWRPHGPGIVFQHEYYLRPGSVVEVSIPLRGETQHFEGHVVLVRETADGYEIGLRLLDPGQETRIRLVEQICYIESHLRSRVADGQKITPNHAAHEWIQQHAATFPSS